jgi:hypothetical protein
MSKIAVDLEQARRGIGRLPRQANRSEMIARLSPVDRAIYSRWSRGVVALYAALVLLGAVSFVAMHDHSNGQSQTVSLQRAQAN